MPPVAQVGKSTVNGGVILSSPNPTMTANGFLVAVKAGIVGTHPAPPFGSGFHVGATLQGCSAIMTVNGFGVVREGDVCSCGHTVDVGTGDSTFLVD